MIIGGCGFVSYSSLGIHSVIKFLVEISTACQNFFIPLSFFLIVLANYNISISNMNAPDVGKKEIRHFKGHTPIQLP